MMRHAQVTLKAPRRAPLPRAASTLLLLATALLNEKPHASREEIREYLSGNYCRCTGYEAIVDAIETTAKNRAAGKALGPTPRNATGSSAKEAA